MLNLKSILLLILSMAACTSAFAERQWPDTVFACQVVTDSGAQGLVSLQSLSLAEAEAGAVGLPVITLAGSKGTAARVLQCIEARGKNLFTDSSFQAWYAKLDK
jgi:hypothetical protein